MKFPSVSVIRAAALAGVAVLGLSGCVAGVVGAGATVGTAAVDERGVRGTAEDARIRAEINSNWVQIDTFAFTNVGLLIHGGRVVLTGTVDDQDRYRQAVEAVRKVQGVKDVYVHIMVDPNHSLGDYANDAGIVAEMRRGIFFDKSIASLNYDLDASNHVLYILGIAQDEGEHQRVLQHARTVSGVRQIVDYVVIKPQTGNRPGPVDSGSGAAAPSQPEPATQGPAAPEPLTPASPPASVKPVEVQPL